MTISTSQLKTTWRGAYDNSTTYNTNDMVLYSGSAWIYRNATSASGNAPGTASADSTAYWYRVTKGSDLGALTLGISFLGAMYLLLRNLKQSKYFSILVPIKLEHPNRNLI